MLRQNVLALLKFSSTIFLTLCLVFVLSVQTVFAAPINGDIVNITLPDGSVVRVRVWGDEYFQHAESLDGYTLIVDKTGWIYYAQLTPDGTDLVSTGIRYRGRTRSAIRLANGQILRKGLKISRVGINRKVRSAKQLLHPGGAREADVGIAAAPQGNVLGLSLLIDFPDVQGAIFGTEMQNFLNMPGYTGFNNNGSVRDYYFAISGGRVTYTQHIFRFTAAHNKSYYTDPGQSYGSRARELVREGLNALRNTGFNFSMLSTNSNNVILAINAFYAGGVTNAWGQGIWPHQGWVGSPVWSANGVTADKYQITGVGNNITLFTTVHENGHLIMGCPDTYDYDGNSRGAGNFDLMSGGGSTNPPPPNPHCRTVLAGWGTSNVLNGLPNQTQVSVTAGNLTPYRWNGPNANEYFFIENIRRTGRWTNMPDEGLLIWHIEANGNNSNEQMTASSHYQVSVEQADGLFDLERNVNAGGANDLFHLGNRDIFNSTTSPNSNWWNGSTSGLNISNISGVGDVMTFILNTTGGPIFTPTRTPTQPVITNTPTRTSTSIFTPTRTLTPNSFTPTRTPTFSGPTSTPTRTFTPNSFTPTRTPTLTASPTSGGGSACSPVTSTITAPFSFDGGGTFCWQSSNLGSFINSWNTTSVSVNGVNVTNVWVSASSLPAKINGFWYVSYNSSVAWGHFEAQP